MKVLIDTCIVIDLLQNRESFSQNAKNIFLCIANHRFDGFLSANSVTDIHYLMHRYTHSESETRKTLEKLFTLVGILPTAASDCRNALFSELSDYEDAIMVETAIREGMDCIITRNLQDYAKSKVAVYSPETFLQNLSEVYF